MDGHARRLRFRAVRLGGVLGLAMLALSVACDDTDRPVTVTPSVATDPASIAERTALDPAILRRALRASPLPPPPVDATNRVADDPAAAALGERLFFDPGLSGDGAVSCATCHRPELRFTDGLPRSRGLGESLRHAPTLVDAAHHRWFNWDGRSDSMWAHAIRPIEHPDEMGGDRTALARYVLSDPDVRAAYESLFGATAIEASDLPDRASPDGDEAARDAWSAMGDSSKQAVDGIAAGVGKVLAAYQRTLVGGATRFDDWVAAVEAGGSGEAVLDAAERRGLEIFFGRGECWECHAGPLFSDGEFHNIGIPAPDGLPRDAGRYEGSTLVREDPFNAAGVHSDDRTGARAVVSRGVKTDPALWGAFRTPTLRGVGETPPYMHDGSMPDLESVVRFYSTLENAVQLDHHQESVLTPLDLSEPEVADLVAFLRTLQGPWPGPTAVDSTAGGRRGNQPKSPIRGTGTRSKGL